MDIILTLVGTGINTLIQIWAEHANKPEGWKPTPQDLADFLAQVDASSPEAEKAAARVRLGIVS
jgi:ubiquinone biosynthesis protein UbiJ